MKKCSNCQKYLLPFFKYTTKRIEDAGKFFCKSCIIKHLGVVEERGGRARCFICHQDLSGTVYRIPKNKGYSCEYYCKKHAINIASENKTKPEPPISGPKIGRPYQTPYSPEVKPPELKPNQRTCSRCGNIYYIDRNWSDYSFCTNPNCSKKN